MRIRALCWFLIAASLAIAESNSPAMNYKVNADWPQLPSGWNFGETPGVAVDAKGHVFVLHRGEHPIIEFTPEGKMVRSWGEGLFIRPHAIRIDPSGNIWTVDNDTHQILKMDPTGRIRLVIGRRAQSGESEEAFNRPTDVAFGPNGEVYISDGYVNSRVVKFSKDGRYITAWGKKGQGPGEFNLPHSVAVDKQGRVYVGDRENFRVQVFDGDGKFLAEWKDVGSPWGLDLQADQTMFIADGYNDRVLKVDLTGKVLGAFGGNGRMPGELSYIHHLEVDGSGNIYVGEIKNQRVQKFVPAK